MARRVHHQPAPGVAGLVLDDAAGDALRLCGKLVLELAEGGLSVQPAFTSAGSQVRALRSDGQPVGVLAQGSFGLVGKKLERFGDLRLQFRALRFRNNAVFIRGHGRKDRAQ